MNENHNRGINEDEIPSSPVPSSPLELHFVADVTPKTNQIELSGNIDLSSIFAQHLNLINSITNLNNGNTDTTNSVTPNSNAQNSVPRNRNNTFHRRAQLTLRPFESFSAVEDSVRALNHLMRKRERKLAARAASAANEE